MLSGIYYFPGVVNLAILAFLKLVIDKKAAICQPNVCYGRVDCNGIYNDVAYTLDSTCEYCHYIGLHLSHIRIL